MSNKRPWLYWDILGGTSQGLYILFWRNRLVPIKTHSVPPLKKGLCAAFWERRGWDYEGIILRGCREGGRAQDRNTHTGAHRPYRDVLAMDSTIVFQLATVSIESAHYEQITAFSFHSQSIVGHLFVWRRSALTYFELVCSCAIVSGSVRLILDGEWRTFKEIVAEWWKGVSKDVRVPCEPQLFPSLLQSILLSALPWGEQGVWFRAEQGEVPSGLHEPL